MTLIPLADVKARTYKERDSWWTVLLVDPLAARITRRLAALRAVTPNRVTMFAFGLGLLAAVSFARADGRWLLLGALLYHLSFTFDCIDGKVARLNGTGSIFGAWLDYILDRVRIVVCTAALMGGQYAATSNITYLIIGAAVIFLDMFRYLNALEVGKVHREISARVTANGQAAKPNGDVRMTALAGGRQGIFHRARTLLQRSRIRPHLFGGIEFQMAVFIVAPVLAVFWNAAIIYVSVIAAALMICFELAVIYMIYRATQVADRRVLPPTPEIAVRLPQHDRHAEAGATQVEELANL
jgi:phosphatidylglycerophosphate synthase